MELRVVPILVHKQNRVARRLVDLDPVFIHQFVIFKRVTIQACATN